MICRKCEKNNTYFEEVRVFRLKVIKAVVSYKLLDREDWEIENPVPKSLIIYLIRL